MNDNLLLVETIDTIAPVTEEKGRAYNEAVREAQEDAAIILAIARHKLSGPEIAGLEDSESIDGTVLLRLQIEFSREIADYKKGTHANFPPASAG